LPIIIQKNEERIVLQPMGVATRGEWRDIDGSVQSKEAEQSEQAE
jgi:hypothetical protein